MGRSPRQGDGRHALRRGRSVVEVGQPCRTGLHLTALVVHQRAQHVVEHAEVVVLLAVLTLDVDEMAGEVVEPRGQRAGAALLQHPDYTGN